MVSAITTHVLDTSTGRPAAGVSVALARSAEGAWLQVSASATDADGRCRDLGPAEVGHGIYRLAFGTGEWFAAQGREAFHPEIEIVFEVRDDRHHHVPVLVAPFGYSTYRGS